MVVERKGQLKTFLYTIPPVSMEEIMDARFNSQWFTPFIFWLAGTAALLFLRPRNLQRRLLALFCYLTATWLAASDLSNFNYMNGSLVLRSAVWLSLPVYLQLHWVFPSPLKRLPGWTWGLLYAFAVIMAAAAWRQMTPPSLYLAGFLAAILGSLGLLGVHLATQPAERRALAGLAPALGMVLMPVVAIAVIGILKIDYSYAGIVVLGLAALPGFYFFTLYRRQLTAAKNRQAERLARIYVGVILGGLLFSVGFALLALSPVVSRNIKFFNSAALVILAVIAMVNFLPFLVLPALAEDEITLGSGKGLHFSANRAASGVMFMLLEAQGVLILAALFQLLHIPGINEPGLGLAAVAMGPITLLFYPGFKRFFERRVLGISLAPEMLAKTFAGRITTSLEAEALQKLLVEEVLPSLLVRQFAQVVLEDGKLRLDFGLRSEGEALPAAGQLPGACGYALEAQSSHLPGWIRVVLALQTGGQTQGYWLLGRRDPDDRYNTDEIATLQTLADQTALARVNIQQAGQLQALYFADIERTEGERLHLAAELHDDVLNQMAVISHSLNGATPAALEAYDQAVGHIREIVNGLRPPLLNYGLSTALESLADELNERHPGGPQVSMALAPSKLRYESRVELYLFRVVQQACSNAIQHAQCQTIRISGSLSEAAAALLVRDDGKGFPAGQGIDLPSLLAGQHFGLAGMFERAALIGAQLEIQSEAGQGCEVSLRWAKQK